MIVVVTLDCLVTNFKAFNTNHIKTTYMYMNIVKIQILGVLLLHLFHLCLQENVPIDTTSHLSQPAVIDATTWKSGWSLLEKKVLHIAWRVLFLVESFHSYLYTLFVE